MRVGHRLVKEREAMSHYLQERYRREIAPALMKEIDIASPMQVPRLEKIVVNVGVGEALENAKALDSAVADMTVITGRSRSTKARKSISISNA
jgi:large subunit ribosomal protein L5